MRVLLLSCERAQAHLDELMEGELSLWKVVGLRGHLLICGTCRSVLRGYRLLRKMARNRLSPPAHASAQAQLALHKVLRQIRDGRPDQRD